MGSALGGKSLPTLFIDSSLLFPVESSNFVSTIGDSIAVLLLDKGLLFLIMILNMPEIFLMKVLYCLGYFFLKNNNNIINSDIQIIKV